MSALHSARKNGGTSRRREARNAPAEWRANAKAAQQTAATTRTAHVAPGDGDSPILTMCLEVAAGLMLWALFGWGVIAAIAWWQA